MKGLVPCLEKSEFAFQWIQIRKPASLVLGSLATVRQRHIKLTASRAPRAGAEQRQEKDNTDKNEQNPQSINPQ